MDGDVMEWPPLKSDKSTAIDEITTILEYSKLKNYLRGRPKEKEQALKYIKEIRSDFSHRFTSNVRKLLDVVLRTLYDGINFNLPPSMNFKKFCLENNVILVPNHQSHADYVLLNYLLYKSYGISIYVAGGENLNIFPLGGIFRKCGCFFIRRTFYHNPLYKLTLEAYLSFLLIRRVPIEFFFEGGRSRTGRILPPRFGLYQMIIEAHKNLPSDSDSNSDIKKDLYFIPVSIVHEYVPEQRSLAQELRGKKKKRESTGQILKIFKIFSYQFGNIHITLGDPVSPPPEEDTHKATQKLAFECFRIVGKNMSVTPTSLLALILLDEPVGALKWDDIINRGKAIIDYCETFSIPYVSSLSPGRPGVFKKNLGRTLDILIGNGKINVIGKRTQQHVFYSIKEDSRIELLYFKNTILHHFLVPWVVNLAGVGLFNGRVNTISDLKNLFLRHRDQLKYEFYLPTVEEFLFLSLKIISLATNHRIKTLDDCMVMSHKDIFAIASKSGMFARVCSYISEGHYLSALAIKELKNQKLVPFKRDQLLKKASELYRVQVKTDRFIRYPEGCSTPVMDNSIKYFENQNIITWKESTFRLSNSQKLNLMIENYENSLKDQLSFNIQPQ